MDKKNRLNNVFSYLREAGLAKTQTDVAERMKASRSNVSAAFNGDLKFLTDNFLRRFNKAYGGLFNDVWLLEGTGEMLASKSIDGTVTMNNEHRGAPVYDIDATCGADVRERMFAEDRVIGYIDLPEIRPNTQIVRANGDSMEPVVKDGNLVAVREVHSWDTVFYGQIYLVLMEEYRMLKYIRRYEPDEEHFVILRSENANYDDMRIAKEKIIKLFIVENILSVKVRI